MAVALAECADLPVARVGGKAQVLGAALRAGFPVPPGVVIEPGEEVDPGAIVVAAGPGPVRGALLGPARGRRAALRGRASS